LELLEQQGMEQEKGDVIRMADHIDTMEIQLGTVLKELGEVKKQLGVMQESKVKLFAVNTIQKAEHQVQTLRFQVGEWKRKFVERAEQAVVDFKEKGKDALASAVKGMHLTQGLQKLQSSLHTVMLSMNQKIFLYIRSSSPLSLRILKRDLLYQPAGALYCPHQRFISQKTRKWPLYLGVRLVCILHIQSYQVTPLHSSQLRELASLIHTTS
jgi:regulator of replication initiation timing